MSSKELQELKGMFDRVVKEEESTKLMENDNKPEASEQSEPNVSMTGKIFSGPKTSSNLLEMRENLIKAEEIKRSLNLNEEDDDDEEFKSITSSSQSDGSVISNDFKPVPIPDSDIPDSDEELLKTFEALPKPDPIIINKSLDEFVDVHGIPIIEDFPGLLPEELPPKPESFYQELENSDIMYREVFERSPNHNMGEILTPIIDDYEEPKIDMEELFDLALIETDEQIYEENYLRHSMALAVFEDKNIDELKELLKDVKKQPL